MRINHLVSHLFGLVSFEFGMGGFDELSAQISMESRRLVIGCDGRASLPSSGGWLRLCDARKPFGSFYLWHPGTKRYAAMCLRIDVWRGGGLFWIDLWLHLAGFNTGRGSAGSS